MIKVRTATSKFIRLRCAKCKNEQIVFGNASSKVLCLVCGKILVEPTGGKAKVKSRIIEILN
ncbi:MAG: 30S ribosomal protein S27e [Candidatus Woesearchaeota archaeon]|jgi:small subunit ribosomal protein S27e